MKELLTQPWTHWIVRGCIAFVATIFALWLSAQLKRLLTWAFDRAEARIEKRAHALGLRGIASISGPAVATLLDTIAGLLRIVLMAVIFYAWLVLVAYLLDDSHEYAWLILNPLEKSVGKAGTAVTHFLPDLVIIVLIVAFGRVIQSMIRAFTKGIALGRVTAFGLDSAVAVPTHRLLSFVLWVCMVILAAPYLPGSESKAFQAVSVMLGLLVSLGSSSLMSNLIGGLTLTYSRAYRVGDRVRIGEHLGDVVLLGAITTRLRTIKDEELILPNGFVFSSVIKNYSRHAPTTGVQANAQITIGYDVSYVIVEALLVKAALATSGIAAEPTPYVLQLELHDYFVRYEVCAYTRLPNELHVIEANLRRRVQDYFFEAGIEICTPAVMALRDGNEPMMPAVYKKNPSEHFDEETAAEVQKGLDRSFRVRVDSKPD